LFLFEARSARRKVVSKLTGRPRGRPAGERRDLRNDPDCSALALGSAFQIVFRVSQRRSFLLALALLKAQEAEPNATGHALRATKPEAWRGFLRAYEVNSKPASSTKNEKLVVKFKSEAYRLSEKATLALSPEEAAFLKQQTRLFCSLLRPNKSWNGHD
jgi:hypothetical protein